MPGMTMIVETVRPGDAADVHEATGPSGKSSSPGAALRLVSATPVPPPVGTALSGYDEIYSDYLRWVADDIMEGRELP